MSRKKGVILSYVLMAFEVISTLLLTPFIIRTIGQAEYGVFRLSTAIVTYLLLLDLGVGNAVVRYIAKFRANNDETSNKKFLGIVTVYYAIISVIVIAVGFVMIMLFPTVFSNGLSADEIVLGQKLLGITILNTAVTIGTAAYNNVIIGYERFDVSKSASIIQIAVRIALTILALKLGMGSIGVAVVNLIMTVLCRAFFIFYVLFKIKLKPVFKNFDFKFIKEIFIYSSFILLQMIATQINAFADQVLLGIIVQNASVIIAVYSVGQILCQYFQTIGSSVTGVLMPGVVKMIESHSDSKKISKEMIRIGRIIFMLLAFIWVCFLVYGKQFILLWVGDNGNESYFVAIALMFAHTFILTESIGTQILWAMNEQKEQSVLKILIVIVNVVLTVFLIQWNPILGATIGTFISLILGDVFVMNLIFAKKIKLNILEYYKELFKGIILCLLISGLAGFGFSFLNLSGWLGFVINISVMAVFYIIPMLIFGMNRQEKNMIKDIIFHFNKKRIK